MTRFSDQRRALEEIRTLLNGAYTAASLSRASDRLDRADDLVANWFADQEDVLTRIWRAMHRGDMLFRQSSASCAECGNVYPRDHMLSTTDTGEWICPHCACNGYFYEVNYPDRVCQRYEPEPEEDEFLDDEEDQRRGQVYSHSTSPINRLGVRYVAAPGETVDRKTRLFGFEIEFEMDGSPDPYPSRVAGLASLQGLGIVKVDGSLSSYGAELCTLPMTRRAIQRLQPLLDDMIKMGARAWNRPRCGLHIHVTRESANWLTWGKVERFFANEKNFAFLDRVAGRGANQYCQRENRRPNDPRTLKLPRIKASSGWERYRALNFDTHKPTVEFRLFRGNVSYKGVLRAAQFCDAIIEFAKTQSAQSQMTYFEFLGWLNQHAQAYPELVKRLARKDKEPVNHELATEDAA